MKNKKMRVVFSAFLIAGFLMGVVNLFLLRFEVGDVYPPYSSLRSDPLGTRVIYESLDKLEHIYTKRNYRPLSNIKSSSNVTLFYLGARMFNSDWIQEDLLKSFEHIARSGGRLVIALIPTLKNQSKPSDKEETSEDSKEDKLNKRKHKNQAKDNQFVSLTERWGVGIGYYETKEKNKKNTFKAESNINGLNTPVFLHTVKFFDGLADSWEVIYASDGHPVIIERKFGKGTIVLSSDSYFFSNEALRKERYPKLLAYFMGSSSKALFDETHLGINKSFGVVYFVKKYRFQWFAAGLFLLAVMFVWKNSVSFVPAQSEGSERNEDVFTSDKDYAQGLVSLLRRNIPRDKILRVCAEEWEKSIEHETRINSNKLDLIKSVVERKEPKVKNDYNPVNGYNMICQILSPKIE
ncbi:MAG: hypothetical protein HKO91_09625 [Desulfobacterales bacterium]|nr:hypothetical protein [Desulfobacterales bacterium]